MKHQFVWPMFFLAKFTFVSRTLEIKFSPFYSLDKSFSSVPMTFVIDWHYLLFHENVLLDNSKC